MGLPILVMAPEQGEKWEDSQQLAAAASPSPAGLISWQMCLGISNMQRQEDTSKEPEWLGGQNRHVEVPAAHFHSALDPFLFCELPCTNCHVLLTNCCNCRAFVINVFTADLSHHSCINVLINIKQAINDPSNRPAFLKVGSYCCHYISR